MDKARASRIEQSLFATERMLPRIVLAQAMWDAYRFVGIEDEPTIDMIDIAYDKIEEQGWVLVPRTTWEGLITSLINDPDLTTRIEEAEAQLDAEETNATPSS